MKHSFGKTYATSLIGRIAREKIVIKLRALHVFALLAICLTGCGRARVLHTTPLPKIHQEIRDDTMGETSVCQLHHLPMGRTTVPIVYGLIMPTAQSDARYAASTNAFPNADTRAFGGCVTGPDSPQHAIIYICPKCQQAAQAWDAKHKKTRPQ